MEQKRVGFSRNFSNGVVKTALYMLKKFSEQNFRLKNCYFFNNFGTSIELFPHFWQFFSVWIFKTACYVFAVKVWLKLVFEIKKFSHQLRTMSEKLSAFGDNISHRIDKSPFYVSIRTFTRKIFLNFSKSFSDKARKNFGFSSIFSGGCQHCSLHIQKNSSMKKTIQINVLSIFTQWAKTFWPSGNCSGLFVKTAR